MKQFAWEVREEDVRRVLESRKQQMVAQDLARAHQRVLLQKDRLREKVLGYRGEEDQGAAARAVIEDILLEQKELTGGKQFYLPSKGE